jgi:hypothetical protein
VTNSLARSACGSGETILEWVCGTRKNLAKMDFMVYTADIDAVE